MRQARVLQPLKKGQRPIAIGDDEHVSVAGCGNSAQQIIHDFRPVIRAVNGSRCPQRIDLA